MDSGSDLFGAYRQLRTLEHQKLSQEDLRTRVRYWWAFARVAYELARYPEVRESAAQLHRLGEEGDVFSQLAARYYVALAELADPSRLAPEADATAALRDVARLASETGQASYEFLSRFALGKLLRGEEGRKELVAAERLSELIGQPRWITNVRIELARQQSRLDPEVALAHLDATLKTIDPDQPWSLYGWEARLEVIWAALPRDEALAESLILLDRIEELRTAQAGSPTGSVGFFSVWMRAYRRVLGYVLSGEQSLTVEELELAFRLSEAMRARLLLDNLLTSGSAAGELTPDPALEDAHRSLRRRIAALQRTPTEALSAESFSALATELDLALLEEERLDRETRLGSAHAATPEPPFLTLRQAQELLGPAEALLVFQAGQEVDHYGAFDGGSWAFVVTRDQTQVVGLPDRQTLAVISEALIGSIARRDGSESSIVAMLYKDILEKVMRAVRPSISHLILVSDGPLHTLPFAVLRPDNESAPLVDRFALSFAPSATIWARGRQMPPSELKASALAFVNPTHGLKQAPAWLAATGRTLGSLPYADREGKRIARLFGSHARVLAQQSASETAIKNADLLSESLLVFATHAIVDASNPRRSSILLASQNSLEDGFLQPPEIARLRLAPGLVVLSACDSAQGAIVQGEGLMSLARSFFEGGSEAVIGTLWPMQDREAADLFETVYTHLAEGRTVAESVQAAQREAWRSGDPVEAWAGVVVLGRGDWKWPSAAAIPVDPSGRGVVRLGLVTSGTVVLGLSLWALFRRLKSFRSD